MPELKDEYTPSALKKLGRKVMYFLRDDYKTKAECHAAALKFLEDHGGAVYTGHHKEDDWSRTHYWQEGWHVVNTTGDYAVVRKDGG